MKEFKRITAFVLTLVLLMSSFAFADNLTTESAVVVEEPTATIVSPLENSIVSSDIQAFHHWLGPSDSCLL